MSWYVLLDTQIIWNQHIDITCRRPFSKESVSRQETSEWQRKLPIWVGNVFKWLPNFWSWFQIAGSMTLWYCRSIHDLDHQDFFRGQVSPFRMALCCKSNVGFHVKSRLHLVDGLCRAYVCNPSCATQTSLSESIRKCGALGWKAPRWKLQVLVALFTMINCAPLYPSMLWKKLTSSEFRLLW